MRTTYRVLAYLIALEVVVQAAAIAYALFGLSTWVQGGGVLDQATMQSETTYFPGVLGFAVHGINGQIVVPALGLLLLIVSFFARVPQGVAWAAAAFGAIVVQVLLGMFAHAIPQLGMLHGAVALVLFGVAFMAARRATVPRTMAGRVTERVTA